MRTRNTAFSLAVILVLLVLLVFAVQQNPQSVDWTLFGQSFALSAGVAIASARLIGFLLAALFVAVFIGAPTDVTTATATTETQAERDLIQSREQYRQFQAEHSRLQTAYNQLRRHAFHNISGLTHVSHVDLAIALDGATDVRHALQPQRT